MKNWLELKPYTKPTPTDGYYLDLCNKVKLTIVSINQPLILQFHLDNTHINMLSCLLTAYFEDKISGTNIWNTFINLHSRLYDKQLPFYDLSEYYEEEINLQDIRFLIWYFLNTYQQDEFIVPFNDFITETAEKVIDIFDSAWDYAPENKHLKTFYTIEENETDFYRARHLIDTILFRTYLFYPDTLLDLHDSELEIIEENRENENLLSFLNENRDFTLHKAHTRLLALKGKEWASKIVGENHPLYNAFPNISQKIIGYFLYKGQDEKDIFIEHIASGKKFNLTKKSFDHSETLKEVDTILFMGIVQWRDEWWFSGVFFQTEFNADLVLDEKNSLEKRRAVNFLDHQEQNMAELLEKQYAAFKDFTNGSQIAFLESNKMDAFISELPFFKKPEGKKILEDIDFLLRFWKKENYFSKPAITFTGEK